MMLEAGSNPRVKNKGGLTALQLVDPSNKQLRERIQQHEYAAQNAGDFITAPSAATENGGVVGAGADAESDDDAEFSGSDDEERAEWERRRKEKRKQRSG